MALPELMSLSFSTNKASEEQSTLIFLRVWGKTSLLAVTWRSAVFSQHAVALLILVQLEMVMVRGGQRHWNRTRTAVLVCTKRNIWQRKQQPLSSPQTCWTPYLSTGGSATYPWSTAFHFKRLLSDTIHLLPASCISADTVTANWCHTKTWEVLHWINCCVTPSDKNFP